MRGDDSQQGSVFSYRTLEERVAKDHPLRPLRGMVDEALKGMSAHFEGLYARNGRPSIAPERLLRALLIQVLFSVRSERQLMEQLEYNLLFRWFVGLGMDDPVWVATTFTKNRERLLQGDVARVFFEAVLAQAHERKLLSSEHFSVDGSLIEAWASHKSFQPRSQTHKNRDKRRRRKARSGDPRGGGGANPSVDFRGEQRRNATHRSTTDPEARLARIGGKGAKLAYQGHVLMDNRHGLVVDAQLTQVDGYAERGAALEMLEAVGGGRRLTLGADRGYDTRDFVEGCRALGVTPHVAQHTTKRSSRIDGRTTRHPGYQASQRCRKRIEEVFGWMKTVGLLHKLRHRGRARADWVFTFTAAAYNLVRLRNLALAP